MQASNTSIPQSIDDITSIRHFIDQRECNSAMPLETDFKYVPVCAFRTFLSLEYPCRFRFILRLSAFRAMFA